MNAAPLDKFDTDGIFFLLINHISMAIEDYAESLRSVLESADSILDGLKGPDADNLLSDQDYRDAALVVENSLKEMANMVLTDDGFEAAAPFFSKARDIRNALNAAQWSNTFEVRGIAKFDPPLSCPDMTSLTIRSAIMGVSKLLRNGDPVATTAAIRIGLGQESKDERIGDISTWRGTFFVDVDENNRLRSSLPDRKYRALFGRFHRTVDELHRAALSSGILDPESGIERGSFILGDDTVQHRALTGSSANFSFEPFSRSSSDDSKSRVPYRYELTQNTEPADFRAAVEERTADILAAALALDSQSSGYRQVGRVLDGGRKHK